MKARRLAPIVTLSLALLAGCGEPAQDAPEAAPDAAPEAPLDAAPAPPADAAPAPEPEPEPADAALDAPPPEAPPDAEPWPDPLPPAAPALAIVHAGRVLAPGETLRLAGPPAGLDAPVTIELTLVWRGAEAITWDPTPAAWLDAPGFTWITPPPEGLDPEATARLALNFDPTIAAAAGAHAARLAVPGLDFTLTVEVALARPLRLVIVGGDGRTLVSDAYGLDLRPASDRIAGTARHAIAWGAGRFFRGWATGYEWQDPGAYAFSDDGINWQPASAAPEFWASGCAFGLDRFTCAVGDRTAWSLTGAAVVHEATSWAGMLHAISFHGDRFVAVGRGGRRAVSLDGVTWAHDTRDAGLPDGEGNDWFFDVAGRDDGLWVAVGGQDHAIVATSRDGGVEWQITRDRASRGASSVACLPHLCLRTQPGPERQLMATADGVEWTPIRLDGWLDYRLLGTANGWFIAAHNAWQQPGIVLRSRDGEVWEELHRAAEQVHWVDMAIEEWAE
ncbi:MAG: hypothetical protein H6705_19695 [Myxococcales bacterium]|nr:hypothetical protein [Myxococcales bacterium]